MGVLVVSKAELDLGTWRARVEIGLVALGMVAGLGLILLGRPR